LVGKTPSLGDQSNAVPESVQQNAQF